MTDTVRFARLDLASIRVNVTAIIVMGLIVTIMTWISGRQEPLAITAVVPLLPVFFVAYPFTNDERGHHDLLYATLPVRRRTVVWGRHLFFMAVQLAAGALAVGLATAAALITGRFVDPSLLVVTTLASLAVGSILLAIQIPLLFWLGFAKSRWIALIPMVVFLAPIALMQVPAGSIRLDTFDPTALSPAILLAASGAFVGVSIVAWVASALISVQVYGRRQF